MAALDPARTRGATSNSRGPMHPLQGPRDKWGRCVKWACLLDCCFFWNPIVVLRGSPPFQFLLPTFLQKFHRAHNSSDSGSSLCVPADWLAGPGARCHPGASGEKRQHPRHRYRGRSQHAATVAAHRNHSGETKTQQLKCVFFEQHVHDLNSRLCRQMHKYFPSLL